MSLACPNCGSRFLRDSKPRSFKEKIQRLWFVSALRCLDCKTRFVTRTVKLREMLFARCPVCYRMDLNGWTGKRYKPPFWMGRKIWLGAKRYRCEYCRLNFASFRKRKEAFTFKRWEKMHAGQARAEALAQNNERRAEYYGPMLQADLSARHEGGEKGKSASAD